MSDLTVTLQDIMLELERIDFLIQLSVARARELNTFDESFRGLYVAEEEIDLLLTEPAGLPRWARSNRSHTDADITAILEMLEAHAEAARARTASQGLISRLRALQNGYSLSRFEVDALLICLAPEIDLRYQRMYGYLQDDITKRHPSVDLVLNLLCGSLPEKMAQRRHFLPGAPLFRHRLLTHYVDSTEPVPPLLGLFVRVDPRIVNYLLASDEIDAGLQPYAKIAETPTSIEQLVGRRDLRTRLRTLAHQEETPRDQLILYFQGPLGVGKRTTATALAHEIGRTLLVVDGERVAQAEELPFETTVALALREAFLQNAVLYWEGFDLLITDERRALRMTLLDALQSFAGLAILAGSCAWELDTVLHGRSFIRIEFAPQSYEERKMFWPHFLNGGTPVDADLDFGALANKFRLTAGQIEAAAATAAGVARWRDPETGRISMQDLYQAGRFQSNRKLEELARKIVPHYTWSDIVLPAERTAQLQEIVLQVRHRAKVYDEWGFEHKLAMGKGLNALFVGPSGTGKTMAADIMAGELGLDLYKIDLSNVVSKYIGETEKNLARIFHEAETSNAILFFDEADALFGKRSEVRDSHDRYANIEISYLLQRMEEYDGVVILATNLHKNMDDAFVRRMHFTIEFPFPDVHSRRRIWAKIWPAETPCAPDLDLNGVAQRFEITGGNVRNIALAAAFLAADEDQPVNMRHLARAIRREYQKMGKVIVDGEFEDFAVYRGRSA